MAALGQAVSAISIHALLAESDCNFSQKRHPLTISIHALLAESDGKSHKFPNPKLVFLSTLSLRRATHRNLASHCGDNNFYPRSPCGERQASQLKPPVKSHNFYPRSPCGERLLVVLYRILRTLFLSTLSLRRATLGAWKSGNVCRISIHALLAESDSKSAQNSGALLRI